MAKADQQLLQVNLRSPYQNYFTGAAVSVSANNRLGRFDILPHHTPFFSLLTAGVVKVRTLTDTLEIRIHNGIAIIKNNQVDVFLNI